MVVLGLGAAGKRLTGSGWVPAIQWGVGAAFAVFFAWALARELDPDHDLSAFVGVALLVPALWLVGLPALLPLLWVLVMARIVNRTSGVPGRLLDSLSLLTFGGWLTWQGNWIYGLATSVAFLLDSQLAAPLQRQLWFAGLALIVTVVASLQYGDWTGPGGLPLPVLLALLLGSALFLLVIVRTRVLRSVGDVTGEPLDPGRVRATQGLVLISALQVAWWAGTAGVVALLSLWAAILGTALYALLAPIWGVDKAGSGA